MICFEINAGFAPIDARVKEYMDKPTRKGYLSHRTEQNRTELLLDVNYTVSSSNIE